MNDHNVLVIGGPMCGQLVPLCSMRSAFTIHDSRDPEGHFRVDDLIPVKPDIQETVYEVHRLVQGGYAPRRTKTVRVATPKGSQVDCSTLQVRELMRSLPWEVPTANILEDFDQWFAATFYKHTGALWNRERGPYEDPYG